METVDSKPNYNHAMMLGRVEASFLAVDRSHNSWEIPEKDETSRTSLFILILSRKPFSTWNKNSITRSELKIETNERTTARPRTSLSTG